MSILSARLTYRNPVDGLEIVFHVDYTPAQGRDELESFQVDKIRKVSFLTPTGLDCELRTGWQLSPAVSFAFTAIVRERIESDPIFRAWVVEQLLDRLRASRS